jgi:RND family efflux transporter MFP subunit
MRRAAVAVLLAALLGGGAAVAAGEAPGGRGFVRSEEKIEVKAKVAAPIRRIAVEEGQIVAAGGVLVEMAGEVLQAEADRARAELARAGSAAAQSELELRIARRELGRYEKVPDLMTERELESARDAVRRADAELRTRQDEVARARAQLAVAETSLGDTVIRAPFDGLVSRVYLRPGATPKPAESPILDFLSLDRLYVEVAVPLPQLPAVKPGMAARVVVEDEHSALTTTTAGRVKFVYPEVDVATRMVRVKVAVERRDLRVLPGMLARITIGPAGAAR